MKRLLLSALVAAGLFGCAPKDITYALNVVTQSCDASANAMEGVTHVRIRVTGDGMEPLESVSVVAAHGASLPDVRPGLNRVIEVRGYAGEPASGGKVVSIGRSLPFEVPEAVPVELQGGPVAVNVVLRKVNSFAPVVAAKSPTDCQRLSEPRAGHSATLLKDGRVFIAGGYNLTPGSVAKKTLASTEIYDPNTGTFEPAKAISVTSQGMVYPVPRAFHASALLPSGQVMLWGGEVYSNGVNNTVSPIASILFYDASVDDFGAVGPRTPAAIARSRHRAAVDANGKVLVVGGITYKSSLVPVDEVEWLDPATNLYKIVPGVTLPRLDATVMPMKKGEYIAVVGGTNGSALVNDVTYFKFSGDAFAQQQVTTPPRLSGPGRRAAAGALIREGNDLVLLGGYSDAKDVRPLASSEVLSTNATMGAGPDVRTARGDICAATLADGTVLAVGGRTSDAGGAPHADGSSVLIQAPGTGSVTSVGGPSLATPRYWHTCTALPDGTVLVTGGLNESVNGDVEILQDAWIYTPAPVD